MSSISNHFPKEIVQRTGILCFSYWHLNLPQTINDSRQRNKGKRWMIKGNASKIFYQDKGENLWNNCSTICFNLPELWPIPKCTNQKSAIGIPVLLMSKFHSDQLKNHKLKVIGVFLRHTQMRKWIKLTKYMKN